MQDENVSLPKQPNLIIIHQFVMKPVNFLEKYTAHQNVGELENGEMSLCRSELTFSNACVCVICTDFDSLIQEEVSVRKMSETLCNNDQKPKGVQHRNRTTFTPEQSKALEQGDLKPIHLKLRQYCIFPLRKAVKQTFFLSQIRIFSQSVCRYVHERETVS